MKVKTMVVGPFETNCYIVSNEKKHALVIDPGYEPERIIGALKKAGHTVTAYLLTHGHIDHVSAVPDVHDAMNAPIAIHEKDAAWVFSDANQMPPYYPQPRPAQIHRLLRDGQEFSEDRFQYEVIWTPGHTQGSVCFYFSEQRILFSGDTLFAESVGRTDLPGGSMTELAKSLNRLRNLPDEVQVYPGHGPHTNIGIEKGTNPFMRCGL